MHAAVTTRSGETARLAGLDWARLACLVGIFFAHSGVRLTPWVFWLCNELAPVLFVSLVGVTSRLTSKDRGSIFAYAGYLTVIGFALSMFVPSVITVLPTLAAVMVLLSVVPDRLVSVLLTAVLAVAGSIAGWKMGFTGAYTLDYAAAVSSPLDGLRAFAFSGAYPLTSYLFAAVLCRWAVRQVAPLRKHDGAGVAGVFVAISVAAIGSVHVRFFSLDPDLVSNPGAESGYGIAAVLLSPQVHAGSIAVVLYGVAVVAAMSLVGRRWAPAAARSSLTGYVLSVVLYGVPVLWVCAVCLTVMEACALVLGRGVIEWVFSVLDHAGKQRREVTKKPRRGARSGARSETP